MNKLKSTFREPALHLAIIAGFIAISFIYFFPVFEGKDLPQMDNIHAKGMSQELVEFEKQHPGEESLWTNSMFGGMPAYQIKNGKSVNVFTYVHRALRFGLPYTTVAILFTYLFGFYILLISLKMNKWLSAIGAIAFAFASYNLIIIEAGHITKTYAIAYMAPALAGFILIYRKKYLAGGLLATLFLGVQLASNHPQITYYLALAVLVFVIVELVFAFMQKELAHFTKASAVAFMAVVLAVAPGIRDLLTTYEYGQESIRGKSELSVKTEEKKSSGLDKDYALAWSYGKLETFTLLIPNFVGGGTERLDESSITYEKLMQQGLQPQTATAIVQNSPTYWGPMPFTSGPVYFGAIVMFLFVLGFFLLKGPEKWWLISITILSILLSWGRNLEWFTDLFFYYFPLYNKFRTVSMVLVVTNVAVVLMAFLSMQKILSGEVEKAKLKNYLLYSGGIVGGILVFLMLFSGLLFDFTGINDAYILSQLANAGLPENILKVYQEGLHADRAAMIRADAIRSFIFILMAWGALYLWNEKKIKVEYLLTFVAVLIIVDLWSIDRRYLDESDFIPKRQARNQIVLTQADEFILKETDPNFRVLNLTRNVFNDAYTPYFHKSIGGYHGAKLRRYQELIDNYLVNEIQALQRAFSARNVNQMTIDSALKMSPVINMLNTKHIIYSEEGSLINMNAFGNVWFVPSIKWVKNADEEMAALGEINPYYVAVIDERFKADLNGFVANDTLSSGDLIGLAANGYKPNHLIYQTNSKHEEFAVFSEIYYDKGWNAYIDDKPAKLVRANYLLRGMVVPAGKHKIDMKFEPKTYSLGNAISFTASIITGLLLLTGLFLLLKPAIRLPAKKN